MKTYEQIINLTLSIVFLVLALACVVGVIMGNLAHIFTSVICTGASIMFFHEFINLRKK